MSTLRTIAAIFAPLLKRKWVSRRDIVFLSFIVILSIALLFVPHTPVSSLVGGRSGLGQGGTSQTTSRNGPGPGGAGNPGGGPGGIDNSQIMNTSSNLVNSTSQSVDQRADWQQALLTHTKPEYTSTNGSIQGAWWGMVGIVDVFVVLIIILNGYRIMGGAVGFRYAESLETLPRVILALVAAHLSIIFVSFWIGLNNQLCYDLLQFSGANAAIQHQQNMSFLDYVGNFFQLLKSMFNPLDFIIPGVNTVSQLLQGVVSIAFLILYFLLLVQAIVRLALINLLTILAPFGFACWALPQGAGQQMTRLWLNAFIASVMVQFLQLTCLVFGAVIYNNLKGLDMFGFSGLLIGEIAIYWLALKIPGWLQNSVVQTMGSASQTVMGVINQAFMTFQQALSSAVLVATR